MTNYHNATTTDHTGPQLTTTEPQLHKDEETTMLIGCPPTAEL